MARYKHIDTSARLPFPFSYDLRERRAFTQDLAMLTVNSASKTA
jgi:hypothetical protein